MADSNARIYGAESATPSGPLLNFIPIRCDGDGNLYVSITGGGGLQPSIMDLESEDPQTPANGLATGACQYFFDEFAGGWVSALAFQLQDDQGLTNSVPVISVNYGYTGSGFDRIRAANVFKTAVVTASGNTAVWTPASGKSFRLMGWRLSVAGTLAADGTQVIQLRDGAATVIARAGANVAAALPAGDSQIGEDYGALGQLSAAANNVLNVNLGTAMATGAVYVDVWGVEE